MFTWAVDKQKKRPTMCYCFTYYYTFFYLFIYLFCL